MKRNIITHRDALIRKLGKIRPFVGGSVVVVERACGNPNCKCRKGDKHPGYYLMWKKKKMTKGVYIPVDLVEEVKKWNEEYKLIKSIVQKVSDIQKDIIRRYVREKRSRRKNA
ncbi:MAG: hypothetical protein Q8O30_12305 [Candidatus Omnitrophota bacterium]|nr:hypothetical protein [Candidatus Omnitrophota bacterium]